ncbi:phosphoinositide 3-kinase adapter protein 1 [Hetaerina americana]|uniref:phosphoinositide 3-kinase adapter protein 1 n=1 Tax=Hetaerina americana TaxID=62018 RepID=UPI003A7F2233
MKETVGVNLPALGMDLLVTEANGKGAVEMDDILIISSRQSQVADLWVNYLKSCFEHISKRRNSPPFRLLSVCLEDFGSTIPVAMEEKLAGVRLQVVIICPLFLDYLFQYPEPGSAIGRLLCPKRVIAMLLGVEENSINEEHRAALISYNQWKHLHVKNKDTKFVAEFLNLALGILSHMSEAPTNRPEKASFSVMPKKVKEGHNKVIVLLTEPLEKEDELSINIDKAGDTIEVPSIKRRNLYTVTFAMPASCLEISMLVGVHVIKNGKTLGCRQVKCESRMRELDQILRSMDNPLEFMCQTLGFSPGDRDQLDSFLLSAFQRNIPPHFNLLNAAPTAIPQRPFSRSEEYPTLLHFAARFGLEKLSWQLLECPGGEHACDMRNVCELTPGEMAEKAGHTKLANSLKGYLQMSEFSSMYSYLKMVCQNQSSTPENLCETDYHKPRPLSETYQVPPSARPLTILGVQSPAMQINLNTVVNGYMEMHPAGNGHSPIVDTAESEHQYLSFVDEALSQEDELQQRLKKSETKKSLEQLDNVQDQLAEIINDFKNNVFTIAEVEKLVENWKNRNDVQQSFKDKQEQLDKMRFEYERLQKKIKDDMKRPTPFDRIRHFFKGKGKDGKESVSSKSSQNCAKSQNNDATHHRPSSSLSLQSATSSSSSEQMSLASGCSGASLGDSGTHSDPEDKKASASGTIQNGNSNSGSDFPTCTQALKIGKAKSIRSYETPPAPRPVHLNLSSQPSKCGTQSSESLENRPPYPVPRNFPSECAIPNDIDDTAYYITPTQEIPTYGERIFEVSRSASNETPRNKIQNTQNIFPSVLGMKENDTCLNVGEETTFDCKTNKSLFEGDQNSPKVPSSPAFSTTSESEFPNYANITSANLPLLQGDVYSSSVPPPVPPRLE